MVNKRIAIILARGGSKRLPRKNIHPFGGKPMVAWSISAAIEAKCFDRVLVSTDDEEIAEISRQFGADVPFLRDEADDDLAVSSEATLVALRQAENYWGEKYNIVAQLMANCPLRTAADIRHALETFEVSIAPSQISAFRFGWMNPWWAAKLGSDGQPDWLFPESRFARSQDLPALYCPTGALWLARRSSLLEGGSFYLQGHTLHSMHWISGMDIDDEADLAMAEACLAIQGNVRGRV